MQVYHVLKVTNHHTVVHAVMLVDYVLKVTFHHTVGHTKGRRGVVEMVSA